MNVRIHIERLVLEGLPVTAAGSASLRAAVEFELSRLVSEQGLHPALAAGGAWAHLPGESMQFQQGANPAALGTQIARAAYRRLGR
jgi:hypothetical protein